MNPPTTIYGLLAQYSNTAALLKAAEELTARGYKQIDAYTPFPVEGLAEAIGVKKTGMSLVVLVGCICGGVIGFTMQWWVAVVAYPLNIGGRPLNSWPSFLPITFELTILGGALSAVLGMLALNGLPCLYHPLFEIEAFRHVTSDAFFICIKATDPLFDAEQVRQLLADSNATEVWDVPASL
ncbi:MAG: quinol:cytochrome c oxidoreductase rane protein [Schlesneria sp.]|nr:quinol:cytochrome c oxidoreductase rane protein [Schlesneria sp.]